MSKCSEYVSLFHTWYVITYLEMERYIQLCGFDCELFWNTEECNFAFMNMVLEYNQGHC